MLGQNIKCQALEKQTENTYKTVLDLSQFPSGEYLVKASLEGASALKTARIIVRQ
tara:strand:+ start:202 stop:366 length:165 start_codon:yes stop_codon:yes gene_type:complete